MAETIVKTFDLSLVTPEGPAFDGEANMVVVPGAAGEIGVLPRHAPLVAMLKAGETRVKIGDEWTTFATGPGYFKIQRDRGIILVGPRRSTSRKRVRKRTTPVGCSRARMPVRKASIGGSSSNASNTPRTSSPSPARISDAQISGCRGAWQLVEPQPHVLFDP